MGIVVEVKGSLLPLQIQALPERAQQAVMGTAYEILKRAADRCPVDTGALQGSLRVEEGVLEALVIAGGGVRPDGKPIDYAPYVEFGTDRAPAQPFLIPAAEEERPAFLERLTNLLG